MNSKFKRFKSTAMFTIVGGVIIINPAFAQQAQQAAPAAQSQDATTLDTVTVTGMRSSLDQAMNIKRDTNGIVDAISAEDIGKFPDTNLAESLQRITGISIERRDGEGAQVTARGFGPGYNMVTLNGRQVPGADGFASGGLEIGGVGSGTRGFNFAQLASEAISGVTVYKTGRAASPSGGIGATIDILTDRPFNHAGGEVVANAGLKFVSDQSQVLGSDVTPEVSGIFSYASADKVWGIGVNASYQKRHGGSTYSHREHLERLPLQRHPGQPAPGRHDRERAADRPALLDAERPALCVWDFERERVNGKAWCCSSRRTTPSPSPGLHLLDQRDLAVPRRADHVAAEQLVAREVRRRRPGCHPGLHPRHRRRRQGLRLRAAARRAEVQAGFARPERALGRQ